MTRGRGNKTFTKWLDETVEHIANSGRKIREIGISHVEGLDFSNKAKEALQKFVENQFLSSILTLLLLLIQDRVLGL